MEAPLSQPIASVRAAPTTARLPRSSGTRRPPVAASATPNLQVFPLALSGNVFGWTADAVATRAILDGYVDRGGNFLDTADSYAAGRSETMIGSWMRDRRKRDDLVIATKIGKSAEHPGLSSPAIAAAVEASLRRLGTDRIDLLYLHVDDPEVPFEETLLAVDELIRSGKVLHFGAVAAHGGAPHRGPDRVGATRGRAACSPCRTSTTCWPAEATSWDSRRLPRNRASRSCPASRSPADTSAASTARRPISPAERVDPRWRDYAGRRGRRVLAIARPHRGRPRRERRDDRSGLAAQQAERGRPGGLSRPAGAAVRPHGGGGGRTDPP